ncbi:hypothetical protein PN441_01970 [Spirulina major CS-329]|uniref:hypothetical protein n=1 Tax=Spirulina TaxID=1154 RepID=UPI00232D9C98|nr:MULTISPECIES: hypothetical protein [Spirulina]MDB9494263.1 hypothetical protein [Spirulina subsalsa CS-330]MDB9501822.1 hypothetical protein [Spirulina major CS-329]
MKRFQIWLFSIALVIVTGLSSFQWGMASAQAQQVTVNDEFTRIAEQCLTAADASVALQACDRALAINDEDPMPWYGKVKALSTLGRTAEADAALRRFDFVGRYYNGMLRPIQLLQRRILLADLVGSAERAAELDREIAEVGGQLNSLSGDERTQAQAYLQRLQSIQEDYQQVQSNPELLQQLESNMIQTMVELRRGFVEANARLNAAD